MRISVRHDIDDLANDCASVARRAQADMRRVVGRNIDQGNRLAKGYARRSAGSHGRHYPNAMTSEMTGVTKGEYGPDAARPQGGMSFEFGSRNSPPHLDLNRSADIQGPRFARDVADLPSKWFW